MDSDKVPQRDPKPGIGLQLTTAALSVTIATGLILYLLLHPCFSALMARPSSLTGHAGKIKLAIPFLSTSAEQSLFYFGTVGFPSAGRHKTQEDMTEASSLLGISDLRSKYSTIQSQI